MPVIDPDRWRVIRGHLDEALELDGGRRTGWLAEQDPAVAAEVQLLLEEHRALDAARFLDNPPPRPVRSALAGRTVGAYTLVEPIGEGGMGTVWLAARSDGRFDRQVAVKFLNVALAGRGEERFRREGALLARLAHPRIARLLDAGVTDTGQPFLILEHIDGEPIDRHCERLQLTVHARIRLLLDVLDAVAHAHANLVVHRDIKPGNVFVDRDGQVKLLDFGIATLIEDGGTAGGTALTRDGGVGMTPEYAAPEQMTGGPVTTATDVYALGVLAYQLLTGRHPAGDAPRSPAAIVKAVVETEPARMSAAAPAAVRRQLRGDLDTIVARMLRKRPEDRYGSATAAAGDFMRYLAHQPITARRETMAYRARKFVRRNWLPVAAVALAVSALAGGWYAANRERLVAERRFQQLRHLANQVIALDRSIRNLPGSTPARQALVADSLEYLQGLAAAARNDLDLALELGDGYWRIARIQGVPTELSLGDFAKAEDSLARADALVDRVLGGRPADRVALFTSAGIAQDRMIIAQSEHRNADARIRAKTAAARLETILAQRSPMTSAERDTASSAFGNIALAYSNMHSYQEAEPFARRAVDLARPLPRSNRLGQGLSLLANILRNQGDIDAAVRTITDARAAAEAGVYDNDATRMMDLYGVLLRQGMILGSGDGPGANRPDDAIEALQRALDLTEDFARRDASDSTSRARTGTAARELGNVLRRVDPARALATYDLGIRRLGEIRNNVKARRDEAVLMANSSYALRDLGRGAEAGRRIDAALSLLSQTRDYPPRTLTVDSEAYTVLRAQADDLAARGEGAEALRIYEDLRGKLIQSLPPAPDLHTAYKMAAFQDAMSSLPRAFRSSK